MQGTSKPIPGQVAALCAGLSDQDRIALGASLIQSVEDPTRYLAVRAAAFRLDAHADTLRAVFKDLPQHPERASTTHEQPSSLQTFGEAPKVPTPAAVFLRRGWTRTACLWRRWSDSLVAQVLGDVLALACIVGIAVALLIFGPLLAGPATPF